MVENEGIAENENDDIERGNTTHSPRLDDKMKQEGQGAFKANKPAHVEEWRETEPFPDETDSPDSGPRPDNEGGRR
jgi:hypothetical protein